MVKGRAMYKKNRDNNAVDPARLGQVHTLWVGLACHAEKLQV